jgi:membrane-associated phospholipid phosphatase
MLSKQLMLLPLFLLPNLICAQDTLFVAGPDTKWSQAKDDGKLILNSILHSYSRPAHWKGDDWLTFGAITVATGITHLYEDQFNNYFAEQGKSIPTSLKEFGFYFGKPLTNYGLTGGVYALGLITDNDKIRHTGILLISSASAAGIIQSVSKTLVGRARPSAGEGKLSFHPISNEPSYHSFPSGHAILSFTTAYAIGKQISNPYLKYAIYGFSMITPVSRLWTGAHWVTDVGLGIAISVVVVDSIDKYLKNEYSKEEPLQEKAIKWQFRAGLNQIGIVGEF